MAERRDWEISKGDLHHLRAKLMKHAAGHDAAPLTPRQARWLTKMLDIAEQDYPIWFHDMLSNGDRA